MGTAKLVRWSKEAKEFFDKAEDNSIVLDLVISYACASQTGEGFEELINSINSESIKRKIKKVVITDTSYLYRHIIPSFSGYCDNKIPTEWYLKNKEAIEKLKVDKELISWFTGLEKNGFKDWYKQIKKDFFMDSNFKDAVTKLAMEFITKNFYDSNIGEVIDFILEETAYTAFNLNDANIIYPTAVSKPVDLMIKKYKLGTRFLSYRVSNHACRDAVRILDRTAVDREVIKFIKDKIPDINFFVVDAGGNIIYMNQSLSSIVCEKNAKQVSQTTWQNSLKVMDKRMTITFEEQDKNKTFLAVKSPLIINEKVEGVIGLSIDITDRKIAEELKQKDLLYNIAKKVAHDISSPIASLEIFKYLNAKKLEREQRETLGLIIKGIKNITHTLLSKYKSVQNKEKFEVKKISEDYIAPYYSITDVIERKRYECYDKALQIKYTPDQNNKFVFMRGEFSNFLRMMTNLINNAENAVEEKGKDGIVEVSYKVIGKEVDIRVTDNGIGMPKEMVEKINNGMTAGTTKEDGHGIGMEQILSTVEEMKCKMEVKSKEGEGTEFKLICDICKPPKWFVEKIEIRKGSVVVVLDDDIVIHDIWKKKLKVYEKDIEVKYFRKGRGAIKYINSIKEKKNVLLLTDYELGDEELINGINVIEKTNLKDSHVLVTSSYLSEIKEFEEKSNFLKTCSKTCLNDIPLLLVR